LTQITGNSQTLIMAESIQEAVAVPWWRVILIGRNPRWTLVRVFVLILGALTLREFAVLPIRVEGISMLPTYKTDAVNLVNRLAYVFGKPQRGDVVAIRMAGEHVMLLKRVVGLPGETVSFRRGRLLIDGQAVEEPYVKLPCFWEMPPVKVAHDEFYVVGDNRSMAWVDHTQGRAAKYRIVGRVIL
jgi:signal peptidase I